MKVDDEQKSTPPRGETTGWRFAAEPQHIDATPQPGMGGQVPHDVEWTASEFVAHGKGTGWYAALGGVAVVAAALAFFLLHDIVSSIIIVLVAVLLGVAASRQPRVLHYQVNEHGLSMGQKFYPYSEFKSFAVMEEGAFSSIMFMPLKRFMPPISIYYAPEDEDRIVQVLSYYLPMETRTHDAFDRLARRIRF
ncbi:MAG TPA: hypothetical protein VIR03_04085 [Candidatus Saccharimonadales bacterium]